MPRFISEANAAALPLRSGRRVSIHASLHQRGKPPASARPLGSAEPRFQSMPRFINEANYFARGDKLFKRVSIHASLHQRGKLVGYYRDLEGSGQVSIHASLHQRGKPDSTTAIKPHCSKFQSMPRFINEANMRFLSALLFRQLVSI